MNYKIIHNNFNVKDLDASMAFYREALGLEEQRRVNAADGSHILVFLGNEFAPHQVELTWLRDWDRPYNLGDNEFHLAFEVDDYDQSLAKHQEMDCVCFINEEKGIYFINDPDGYWLEILPVRKIETL